MTFIDYILFNLSSLIMVVGFLLLILSIIFYCINVAIAALTCDENERDIYIDLAESECGFLLTVGIITLSVGCVLGMIL